MSKQKYFVRVIFKLIVLIGFTLSGLSKASASSIVVSPEVIRTCLKNQGAGLVLPMWMNKKVKNKWYLKYFSVGYTRWTWAELEPEYGAYRFEKIVSFCRRCKELGLKPAFRIMSTVTSGTATPMYIFREGVPSVEHKNGKQIDPVYWDSRYLTLYEKFIMAVGRFMGGGKGLEFVDMGGIGVWGEMHLGLFLDGMWSRKQLLKTHFSQYRYTSAYHKMISIYKRAFPNTRLLLNISHFDDIAAYAASQGVGLRFDGLRDRLKGTLYHVSRIFKKYGIGDLKLKPVPCVYEFAAKKMSFISLEKAVRNALTDPISYLHFNIGSLSSVRSNVKNLIITAARKIGFRLALKRAKIEVPDKLPLEGSWMLQISHEWCNLGVAPPTRDYALCLKIMKGEVQKVFHRCILPALPTTKWIPSKTVKLIDRFVIPEALGPGVYTLKISMNDPDHPSKFISLAIRGRDAKGFYGVAKLLVTKDGSTMLKPFLPHSGENST